MKSVMLALLVCLSAACTQPSSQQAQSPVAPAPEAAALKPATPSGPPIEVAKQSANDALQAAAAVVQIDPIDGADAKLFGTAAGDPAINGLYTYIAVFESAAQGWSVFQIGDFNSYKVDASTPEQVTLTVSRSWIDETTGEPKTKEERLIVAVPTPGATTVSVTPAT